MTKHRTIALNVIYGYRCNYFCEGCCNGSDQVDVSHYDPNLDTTLNAIEKLPDYVEIAKGGMITLLGGEPFLYWDDRIVPIAKALRKAFPTEKINIFSNGHLLGKNLDRVIELMRETKVCVTVSMHFYGDATSNMGQAWARSIDILAADPRINKISDEHYDLRDCPGGDFHFHHADKWFTWYKQTPNGSIKPFASGSPEKSMQFGCASGNHCSAIFENRLYKCGSLAMLPGFLKHKKQFDDPDWSKYLDYPYIDLFNVDYNNLYAFNRTYGKPIPQCDMCNDAPANVIRWVDRKEKSIFPNLK